MNYVVHFYYYPDYVVYCKTLDEVKQVIDGKGNPFYTVYETSERVKSGVEMAAWAWEIGLRGGDHTRKVIEL